ncbi:MAG: hypothetical protein K6B42_01175 [Clostridia bacterium]|nr:hypothetical protein [Clostridia bacterium]
MRELDVAKITQAVAELYVRANYHLGEDVKACLADCARDAEGLTVLFS